MKKLLGRFESISGVEQRGLLERIVGKIVIKPGNCLDLHLSGEWPKQPFNSPSASVTLRNKKPDSERIGGVEGTRTLGLPRDRRTL